jgi:uncharacterized LabA/DUF88 family protein
MKKVAILIDGGFFTVALRHDLKLLTRPSAQEVYQHARRLARSGTEEIWRIFYYDSHPSDGRAWHPITHKLIELAATPPARARERLDVAMLAMNHYVDRIIVASNDTDLIPALKVARQHGIQVVIAQIGSFNPHPDLVNDSDFKRPRVLHA